MDYEKAYKETIDKLRKLYNDWDSTQNRAAKEIELVFPELIESEDEKIRKDIMDWLINYKDNVQVDLEDEEVDRWVSWLEKHGEQESQGKSALEVWKDMRSEVYQQASGNRHEPNYSDDSTKMFSINDIDEIFEKVAENQCEQKLADKVEPKSEIIKDKWYICTCTTCTKDSRIWFKKGSAYLGNDILKSDLGFEPNDYQDYFRIWTIHDAKDGDVLAYPDGTIVLFKYRLDGLNSGIYMSHILLATKIETYQSCAILKDLHPATKEQSVLLFQKMKEAGYEWDIERKKLKKIEQKPTEWSEDDKEMQRHY